MYKRNVLRSLFLAMGLIFCFCASFCYAEEQITITTFYPSPYGSYNALQTNKLAVGDANNDDFLTDADQPNRSGDIRFKPQTGNPNNWPVGEEGQLAYSQVNDEFYHSNGSEWVAQGGGTTVMYLSCAWGTDHTAGSGRGWDGSCTPPSCPSGWTSAATYSEPLSVACSGHTNCSWGFTGYNDHPVAVGRSVHVCTK